MVGCVFTYAAGAAMAIREVKCSSMPAVRNTSSNFAKWQAASNCPKSITETQRLFAVLSPGPFHAFRLHGRMLFLIRLDGFHRFVNRRHCALDGRFHFVGRDIEFIVAVAGRCSMSLGIAFSSDVSHGRPRCVRTLM